MSVRRKMQKQMRLARPHEGPFREMIAYREAFIRLGIRKEEIAVSFEREVSNPEPHIERCVPIVAVTRGKGFAIRALGFEVKGSVEEVQKLWREWVLEIIGEEKDFPEELADEYWYKSKISRETVFARLRQSLVANGIEL